MIKDGFRCDSIHPLKEVGQAFVDRTVTPEEMEEALQYYFQLAVKPVKGERIHESEVRQLLFFAVGLIVSIGLISGQRPWQLRS